MENVQTEAPMPSWVITLLVGLILNLLLVAYSAGLIVSRVGTLQDRFNYLEMRFNEFVERGK
jgi:hypothetical protein